MPDLDRDAEALTIKALEIQINIDEMKLAGKRQELDLLRAKRQIEQCAYNIEEIAKSVAVRQQDLEATQKAALGAEGVNPNG